MSHYPINVDIITTKRNELRESIRTVASNLRGLKNNYSFSNLNSKEKAPDISQIQFRHVNIYHSQLLDFFIYMYTPLYFFRSNFSCLWSLRCTNALILD